MSLKQILKFVKVVVSRKHRYFDLMEVGEKVVARRQLEEEERCSGAQ